MSTEKDQSDNVSLEEMDAKELAKQLIEMAITRENLQHAVRELLNEAGKRILAMEQEKTDMLSVVEVTKDTDEPYVEDESGGYTIHIRNIHGWNVRVGIDSYRYEDEHPLVHVMALHDHDWPEDDDLNKAGIAATIVKSRRKKVYKLELNTYEGHSLPGDRNNAPLMSWINALNNNSSQKRRDLYAANVLPVILTTVSNVHTNGSGIDHAVKTTSQIVDAMLKNESQRLRH